MADESTLPPASLQAEDLVSIQVSPRCCLAVVDGLKTQNDALVAEVHLLRRHLRLWQERAGLKVATAAGNIISLLDEEDPQYLFQGMIECCHKDCTCSHHLDAQRARADAQQSSEIQNTLMSTQNGVYENTQSSDENPSSNRHGVYESLQSSYQSRDIAGAKSPVNSAANGSGHFVPIDKGFGAIPPPQRPSPSLPPAQRSSPPAPPQQNNQNSPKLQTANSALFSPGYVGWSKDDPSGSPSTLNPSLLHKTNSQEEEDFSVSSTSSSSTSSMERPPAGRARRSSMSPGYTWVPPAKGDPQIGTPVAASTPTTGKKDKRNSPEMIRHMDPKFTEDISTPQVASPGKIGQVFNTWIQEDQSFPTEKSGGTTSQQKQRSPIPQPRGIPSPKLIRATQVPHLTVTSPSWKDENSRANSPLLQEEIAQLYGSTTPSPKPRARSPLKQEVISQYLGSRTPSPQARPRSPLQQEESVKVSKSRRTPTPQPRASSPWQVDNANAKQSTRSPSPRKKHGTPTSKPGNEIGPVENLQTPAYRSMANNQYQDQATSTHQSRAASPRQGARAASPYQEQGSSARQSRATSPWQGESVPIQSRLSPSPFQGGHSPGNVQQGAGKNSITTGTQLGGTRETQFFNTDQFLAGLSSNLRLLGEIAFQLDRRILSYIFHTNQGPTANKKRLYGYIVQNIADRIWKESADPNTGLMDMRRRTKLEYRYSYIIRSLGALGYRLEFHPDFAADLVNQYGLLPAPHGPQALQAIQRLTASRLGPIVESLAPPHEREGVLVLLDCLQLLASDDGRPLFIW